MMQAIIPEKHQRKIFDLLIQSGLDTLIKEGEVRSDIGIDKIELKLRIYTFKVAVLIPVKIKMFSEIAIKL